MSARMLEIKSIIILEEVRLSTKKKQKNFKVIEYLIKILWSSMRTKMLK